MRSQCGHFVLNAGGGPVRRCPIADSPSHPMVYVCVWFGSKGSRRDRAADPPISPPSSLL